jgi:hypothetical protein
MLARAYFGLDCHELSSAPSLASACEHLVVAAACTRSVRTTVTISSRPDYLI